VGKSSLINLIAEKKVCETSSGALGCTLEYKRHLLDVGDQRFAIWDTAGLDEGTQGSVPAEKAEAYLKQLLHELAKNNGVDLLVYCVRGTRVRSALLTNYHIFYSAICRKKVPIVIVITGLENQEDDMETWWYNNELQFSSLNMQFDSHACVTTLESSMENAILKERREASKAAVIKMITSTCRTQHWKPAERSWVESAYSDIRAMLSPRDSYSARLATVIMCETSRDRPGGRLTRKRSISFQSPVALSFSFNPLSFRKPVLVSADSSRSKLPFEDGIKYTPERLYRVYQVSPKPAFSKGTDEEIGKVTVVKRGADLLIFCVRMEETESRAVRFQWEDFNFTYGGDLSPQIVVVVGALNQSIAEKWWKDAIDETFVKNDVDVAYWPLDATGDAARTRLQYLINDRCIDCSKVSLARNEKLFRRPLFLDMSNLTTLWVKPAAECDVKGDGPRAEQDILTKVGVWYEIPDRSPSMTSPVSPTRSQGQL
jgi:hypothetical protein